MKRDEMIMEHLNLIHYTLKKIGLSQRPEYEDLYQQGMIGLIKAVDSFDETKGYTFSSYAFMCVRNSVFTAGRSTKRYTDNVTTSLDKVVTIGNDGIEISIANSIPSEFNLEQDCINRMEVEKALKLLERLDEKSKFLIKANFGIGMNELKQADIAKALGMTQSYASRLIAKNLKKLRKMMEEEK